MVDDPSGREDRSLIADPLVFEHLCAPRRHTYLIDVPDLETHKSCTMAKSKPSKKALSKARRHNPIRVPDSHLPSGSSRVESSNSNSTNNNTSGSTQQLLPVLQKLTSTSPSDRAWSASTISTLISNDPATRRLFLGKNVLEKLVGLLSDGVGSVRVEGSGALR